MKTGYLTILFAAAGLAIAGSGYAQYGACVNNNSKECVDARNAFARHHGGVYPNQYYNQWYGGRQGRWAQQNNEWRYEGMDGDDYWRGNDGWNWRHRERAHEHEHHHDHD